MQQAVRCMHFSSSSRWSPPHCAPPRRRRAAMCAAAPIAAAESSNALTISRGLCKGGTKYKKSSAVVSPGLSTQYVILLTVFISADQSFTYMNVVCMYICTYVPMYVLIFERLMDNSMGPLGALCIMLSNSISGFKSNTYGKFSCRIFHLKDSYNVQPKTLKPMYFYPPS
jgi:hypothetical protein